MRRDAGADEEIGAAMHRGSLGLRCGPVMAAVLLAAAGTGLGTVPAAEAAPGLVAHRAVYDLKLVRSQGKRTLQSVRGRILYDFSGNACDGFVLQFRQVSELDNGEGKVAVSDLRASTWEEGAAKSFRFSSQNYINNRAGDMVDGKAERRDGKVTVSLVKPKEATFDADAGLVFPTEHMRRVLAAARDGKTLLELPVYDGSETGQKLYQTLTVIGAPIGPESRPEGDATAGQAALEGLRRWPVTISYFDRAAAQGEQTPVYSIAFQLFENGVSRALRLDYGDFVVSGEMSQLDIKPDRSCP